MTLTPGTRLGPYEILAAIGAGGMGEVYRARDMKLNREVAIKVVPTAMAQDRERLIRFEREAKVLASLNHPNIAQIYGLEESGNTRALVMELVPGSTLSVPQPLETALHYARQIAEALEAAHEKGITHRDLKPGNIMITPEGVVKVLDFGLAAIPDRETGGDPASSPTLTIASTQAGMIMGTAAYMSPEQASGKSVDKRSDIWSFGVVLCEMLTGRRLFDGETVPHTLADVLRSEIDLRTLPANTPPAVRTLLRRCLDRNVRNRLRDIGEARVALDEPSNTLPAPDAPAPRRWRVWAPWAVAAAAVAALLAVILTGGSLRQRPAVSTRFAVSSPEGTVTTLGSNPLTLSPDGRNLALVETDTAGKNALWIRSLDSGSVRRLEHTEGATNPFWSPDGRFLAFNLSGRLAKIAISGGPLQTICEQCGNFGTWGADGVILTASRRRINRIPAAGGAPIPITELDEAGGEVLHLWPQSLPDGKHFLYLARNKTPTKSGIYVQELGSSRRILVMNTQFRAAFSRGYLLFVRDGTLLAQSIDAQSFQLRGEPAPVADEVALSYLSPPGIPLFTVSENGSLAYRSSHELINRQLVWHARDGSRIQTLGEPGAYTYVKLSADDKRVAVTRRSGDGDYPDIWEVELASGIFTRRTFDSSVPLIDPNWSPDSRRIAMVANRDSKWEIRENVAGSATATLVYSDPHAIYLGDWSRDGRFLIFHSFFGNQTSVYLLPLIVDRKPQIVTTTPFTLDQFHFSPDGHWIAYSSNESGRHEIYVASLPTFSEKRQVSAEGGVQPLWRNDGKEVFFLSFEGKLMAADVKLSPTLDAGIPKALFQTNVDPAFAWDFYAAAGDGKKFLMIESPKKSAGEVNVVLNWDAGLHH